MSRISVTRGSPARVLGFLVVLLVAVLGSAAIAQASSASLPATVTGYVKDGAGAGIPNCLVEISGETSVATPWDPFNVNFSQEATTDATGLYVITDVIQGTYSMYVNQPANDKHLHDYSEAWPWNGDLYWPPNTLQMITGGTTVNVADIVLPHTGTIHGHAMDGAAPIEGAGVIAQVTTEGVQFERWTSTGADGGYTVDDATPGDWTVAISGKDRELPAGATSSSHGWENGSIVETNSAPFEVDSGDIVNLPDTEFDLGRQIRVDAVEEYASNSYWLPDVSVNLSLEADPYGHTYYFTTGEDGYCEAYLPAGDYHLSLADSWGAYQDKDVPVAISLPASASEHHELVTMTPAAGTYAVYGKVTEAVTGNNVASWISASKIDPGSVYTESYRRAPSNGSGNSLYLIRLPQVTGYTGHKMKLDFSDQASPPDIPYVHVNKSVTVAGPGTTLLNVNLSVGGSISGTIHDNAGDPVPGCLVSVARKAFDPGFGGITWSGADNWYTRTETDGTYTIGGLPANTDYKVNIVADYNPGWLLPEMYKNYYRKTYKNQPLVDSLNTSASPIGGVVDHTPVAVTLGHDTGSINETISPGGYVALHADGPTYPTGAVWCDVMYQYGGQWFEIDSGYTTGGLFRKVWKVLPTGNYRVEYNDYFGRGGGTWTFSLAPGEHKYASVLVPAPVTFMSGSGSFTGAFAGIIGSGMKDGGAGGAMLTLDTTSTPLVPLPSGTILIPGTSLPTTLPDVHSTGTSVDGVWTLTLPYDPVVPDADVPYLRVVHYKLSGGTETLSPIGWNTLNHTVMVQTSSLSPFLVVYKRHGVTLGRPVASSKWKKYKAYTVYGSLAPKHNSGAKSVKIKVYRKNSKGHYSYYKSVWAPNYTYHSGTRYRAKFGLKSGKYRFYAYAVSDAWHLATTSKYKSVTVK